MSAASAGFVWLVGAGPGDPDLLTRKAERVLAEAEVVFYDGLVPLEILALAPRAQRFSVAKRSRNLGTGAPRPGDGGIPQDGIHRLLIRAARRGKRVVRLKGGDPFVFGRGGEEALALAAAGVPFEVVPGVSSALAAPALAGIPVTHRGLASGFVVVAGHDAGGYGRILGGLAPQAATVVVLMGLGHRGDIADFLLARGWAAATPAAMLLAAGTPESHTWTGTLAELGAAPIPSALESAAGTLVIGEVVAVASTLGVARGRGPARQGTGEAERVDRSSTLAHTGFADSSSLAHDASGLSGIDLALAAPRTQAPRPAPTPALAPAALARAAEPTPRLERSSR